MGELRSSSWEDREGNRRISYEIRADNVQFLSPPRGAVQEEVEEFSGLGANFEMEEAEPFVYEGGKARWRAGRYSLEKDDREELLPFKEKFLFFFCSFLFFPFFLWGLRLR